MTDLITTRDQFLAELSAEQAKRDQYNCLSWIEAERGVMHAAVNRERLKRHLQAVTVEAIKRVETWALGHSDYSSKFALYCAEIALGMKQEEP